MIEGSHYNYAKHKHFPIAFKIQKKKKCQKLIFLTLHNNINIERVQEIVYYKMEWIPMRLNLMCAKMCVWYDVDLPAINSNHYHAWHVEANTT